jgi:hypothetical protein
MRAMIVVLLAGMLSGCATDLEGLLAEDGDANALTNWLTL